MATETVYEHAKRIDELHTHQNEIARSEGRTFEDYSARDLVLTAKSLLDLMEEWDVTTPASRGQQRRLRNFVKKWEGGV